MNTLNCRIYSNLYSILDKFGLYRYVTVKNKYYRIKVKRKRTNFLDRLVIEKIEAVTKIICNSFNKYNSFINLLVKI